jgi:hypothetical protein
MPGTSLNLLLFLLLTNLFSFRTHFPLQMNCSLIGVTMPYDLDRLMTCSSRIDMNEKRPGKQLVTNKTGTSAAWWCKLIARKFIFHICAVHPAIIKVFCYHLMHERIDNSLYKSTVCILVSGHTHTHTYKISFTCYIPYPLRRINNGISRFWKIRCA